MKIHKLMRILQNGYYARVLLRHKVAAGVEHTHLLEGLCSGGLKTIVDIGANRGQFALVARRCFPEAKIYSFEPLREAALIFRRVFATDPHVVLYQLAIGPRNEDRVIHVSRADDSSSLLPIAALQNNLFPGTEEKEQRKVTVLRLDEVLFREDIEGPALLKIDVQGFEEEVLEGCQALLPCFSHVYIECSFVELYGGQALAHEIISFLSSYGFHLSGIYNLYYDKKGVAIQGDFMFERKKLS
jgi:FkbM family methyltransferase